MKYLPFLLLLAVVLGCNRLDRDFRPLNRTPTPLPNKPSSPKLSADVSLSDRGIVIKNTDSVDFTTLTIKINMTEWGGYDASGSFSGPAVGKTITIPYSELAGEGTDRFDIRKTKILTVFVKDDGGTSKLFLCPGPQCRPA